MLLYFTKKQEEVLKIKHTLIFAEGLWHRKMVMK